MPVEAAYLWEWFLELNGARGGNGFGANPITYAEMAAWEQLTGRRLEPWEVRWLVSLDKVWLTGPSKTEAA